MKKQLRHFYFNKISGSNGAAALLELAAATLESKMKKLGIKKQYY